MKTEATQATRDVRSDVLKAAAIVGVVAIHASFLYADVFRFGVPVFIAIWAFYYDRGLSRRHGAEAWTYAAHRFLRLLVPYAFWTLLYLALFHHASEWRTTPRHTIVGGWFGGYGWPGQYFFIVLFQLTWIVPLLRRFVTPVAMWTVVLGGSIFNAVADYFLFRHSIISGLGDRLFVYWLAYAVLGIAFAKGFPKARPLLGLAALALLLAAPWEMARLATQNDKASVYLLPTVTLGSIALLLAAAARAPAVAKDNAWSKGTVARIVLALGRNSFAIFVCNPLVLAMASRIGFTFDNSLGGTLGKAVLIALTLAISIAIAAILRRLKLGILVGG